MPPRDQIFMTIGNERFDDLLSYQVSSNLFQASDGFSLTHSPFDIENIVRGARCELFVNGHKELKGIINKKADFFRKGESGVTFEGTDLLGELAKRSATIFKKYINTTLEELTADLIKDIRLIDMTDIVFADGSKDQIVTRDLGTGQTISELIVNPGDKIIEILLEQARLLGLRLFSAPDGRIIFGRLKTSVAGAPALQIDDDMFTDFERIEDISGLFDTVSFVGSSNKNTGFSRAKPPEISGTSNLSDFLGVPPLPTGLKRPMIINKNLSQIDAQKQAALIHASQIFKSDLLNLTVYGHTDRGTSTPWETNQIVKVNIPRKRINGLNFLIFLRTFIKRKKKGTTTQLSMARLENVRI